jgi:hypothetical protein
MPSDDRTTDVLGALAAPRDQFQSALAATVDSVRALLDEQRARAGDRLGHLSAEFGMLGPTYLDIDRLAAVVDSKAEVDPATMAVVERAYEQLKTLAERPDGGLMVTVPPGGSFSEIVSAALATTGRAIGASRVVTLAQQGRFRPAEHDRFLERFPFDIWSQAERQLAPPLVVQVAGADLRPAALAEYLDGDVKFVLIVDAPATPAPLVRLVTPGTFVAQSQESDIVARLAAWDGPGVVAIMPEGAAEFVHDPAGGESLGGRLTVTHQPDGSGLHRIGPFTTAQQRDEVQQLAALVAARAAAAPAAAPAQEEAHDPVGKLAAWLLSQAEGAAAGKDRRREG